MAIRNTDEGCIRMRAAWHRALQDVSVVAWGGDLNPTRWPGFHLPGLQWKLKASLVHSDMRWGVRLWQVHACGSP
eukprot:14770366-Alexandrium_andersonii.AAC.1